MEWLTQNWIWIIVAIGLFLVMQRARSFGPHGAAHDAGPGTQMPGAVLDPVTGNAVRTDGAPTSVRRGQIFYFESAETRQRFEADPDKYAAGAATPGAQAGHRHRHGGCC